MMKKRLMSVFLPVFLILVVFLWDYTARAASLAEIIEGAKKEGTVSAKLRSAVTPKSLERAKREIKEKFGVDLKILQNPSADMQKDLAEAIMEHKLGAVPSSDIMTSSTWIASGMKAGIYERVDWKPIITKDTNPDVVNEIPSMHGAILYFTGHLGLMVNPQKVPASEIPKTLIDLANPKWKGKVGIHHYTTTWAIPAFVLGKDKVLSALREILKNGAITGRYVDIYNRFLLGETPLCVISSTYLQMAQSRGMPAAWVDALGYAEIREYFLAVRKGAPHPNAAKLLAIYLASAQGAKFMDEATQTGNLYYPGNYENDLSVQSKKQGIREVIPERDPKIIEFTISDEVAKWEKEIQLILDTTLIR